MTQSASDKKTLTFSLMDPPFENARSTTAFRLINSALLKGYNVNVFAYEGAAALAFSKQSAHANKVHGAEADEWNHPLPKTWVSEMMTLAQQQGSKLDWINCGLCEDERGVGDSVEGVRRGTPGDLLAWAESSDNTLVIPTK